MKHPSPCSNCSAASRMTPAVLLVFALFLGAISGLEKMTIQHEWSKIEFAFPNNSMRESFIERGDYIPGNAVPMDVHIPNDGRIFMSMPNLYPGAPVALATVSNHSEMSPVLIPYPDWSYHMPGSCDSMTSVFRIWIDECNRLWAIDSGVIGFGDPPSARQICTPQLLIFDLNTDTLIRRYRIPEGSLTPGNLLATIVVDAEEDKCDDAFAYIADVYGFSVYVYNFRNDVSWRVKSRLFYPYPLSGVFIDDGILFYRMGGILGLGLSPREADGNRRLYTQSQASVTLSWVETSILKNSSYFPNGVNLAEDYIHVYNGTRDSQAPPIVMDDQGVLFFSQIGQNTLSCWNSEYEYGNPNIEELERDHYALQFVVGIKVLKPLDTNEEEVWMVDCSFQKIAAYTYNNSETNLRVIRGNKKELVQGTTCDVE